MDKLSAIPWTISLEIRNVVPRLEELLISNSKLSISSKNISILGNRHELRSTHGNKLYPIPPKLCSAVRLEWTPAFSTISYPQKLKRREARKFTRYKYLCSSQSSISNFTRLHAWHIHQNSQQPTPVSL
jgi:hypothetical protein